MINIKVKKLLIHNFMSFKDEEWDFDNTGRIILVKGLNKDTESTKGNTSNGSGKSTWSHALMYALFGQLPGKFHISNLQNLYANDIKDGYKMSVDVEIDTIYSNSEMKHWRIVRGLQKTQSAVVQLFSLVDDEWTDISKSTGSNTQKYIDDNVTHMNFEMYQRLVMLSIEDKYNFFKLTAAQKRDFVETLFDTSIYSKMFKMMNDDFKTKNMLVQNLKVNQVKYAKTKEICEDEIAKYKDGVYNRISELTSEMESKQSEVSELEPKFDELSKQQEVVKAALDKVRETKKKLDSIVSECSDKITNAKIEISNCNSTISHHERELNKHKEVLGMICDDCKQIVNKFYSLDVYRNEIDKLRSTINVKEGEIEVANQQISKVDECSTKIKNQEVKTMEELSELQVQERNLKYQKNQILNFILGLEKRISELKDSIEDESKIPSYGVYQETLNNIEKLEKDLKSELSNMCLLKVGSDIVSPDAIRKNIISRVVSSINAMINANLSELRVNFTCQLSSDMNDYQIMSSGNEVDLSLRSAGEQMKLLISTQLAFRRFLMSRFNVVMNVMIIDEVVDRALDSVSIHTLLEMLLRLSQKENTSVSIVSHREEVSDMIKGMDDTQLVVIQKENNISRILKD